MTTPSAAFVLRGLVPLVSYLTAYSLVWSVAATGPRTLWHRRGEEPMVAGGLGEVRVETLLIGMSAASLSFLIGFGLRAFVKVPI